VRARRAVAAFAHDDLASAAVVLPADPAAAKLLREQLAAASNAADRLLRLPHLEDAGYYFGSNDVAGVGAHYIDWHLVGQRFDPAHPAMLLIDSTPGHVVRLAGFSYWVRSARAPEGFAGGGDQWHQHRGLCFVGGVLDEENVPDAAHCAGVWLNGGDLWMLHVWLLPGYENPAGLFAPRNTDLCPARVGPEIDWC
jgi:hypothetical protein